MVLFCVAGPRLAAASADHGDKNYRSRGEQADPNSTDRPLIKEACAHLAQLQNLRLQCSKPEFKLHPAEARAKYLELSKPTNAMIQKISHETSAYATLSQSLMAELSLGLLRRCQAHGPTLSNPSDQKHLSNDFITDQTKLIDRISSIKRNPAGGKITVDSPKTDAVANGTAILEPYECAAYGGNAASQKQLLH